MAAPEWLDRGEVFAETQILGMLKHILPILEESGVQYWLGRGCLRTLLVMGSLGDKTQDLDFHIRKGDCDKLLNALKPFIEENKITVHRGKPYKLVLDSPHKYLIEFMYLEKDTDNRRVFHARYNGKRYCPAYCFSGYDLFEFEGLGLRIPVKAEDYLACTYGLEYAKMIREDKDFMGSFAVCEELLSAQ